MPDELEHGGNADGEDGQRNLRDAPVQVRDQVNFTCG